MFKTVLKKVLCAVLALLLTLLSPSAFAMTRDELRAAYDQIAQLRTASSPYNSQPDVQDFSSIGEISPEKMQDALNYLNFIRSVAGLSPVSLSEIYSLRSQNAALLLAANDSISHNPSQPDGMHDDLYDSALLGASTSNLARFNWMKPDILLDGIAYYVRDDGDMNLADQGHRRWLLNPEMVETGFGLASAASGNSYVTMFAVDNGNTGIEWDYVAWPTAGAFPVELMRSRLAWSVSLNESNYNIEASFPIVEMTERASGAHFRFEILSGEGNGFCSLSKENYGSGPCIIFRPDMKDAGIAEYVQNQVWDVSISGLIRMDGSPAEIRYSCEMASLYPQDVANVEISQLEAELEVGQSLQLRANVIPAYADDLRINWISSDGSVAMVTANGLVTALGSGNCSIIAESMNGRQDICLLRVYE